VHGAPLARVAHLLEHAAFDDVHRRLDADLVQHARHGVADVGVGDVLSVLRRDRHRRAEIEAGILQHLLGLRRVEGPRLQVRIPAQGSFGQDLAVQQLALAFQDLLEDKRLVDRIVEGLATLGLSNGLIVGSKVSTRPTVVLMLSTLALPELFTWSIRSIRHLLYQIWLRP
jgi:hypothetical protein